MNLEVVKNLLQQIKEERSLFIREDSSLALLVERAISWGVYPERSQLGRSAFEMVQNYGQDWHIYAEPLTCQHCGSDLRDLKNGPPYKREIAQIYRDRLWRYLCPDCGETLSERKTA